MKRAVFAILSAVSLLLLLMSTVLWAISGHTARHLWQTRTPDGKMDRQLYADHGRLMYQTTWIVMAAKTPPTNHAVVPIWCGRCGFMVVEGFAGHIRTWWYKKKPAEKHYNYFARRTVGIELWLIAGLSSILPIAFLFMMAMRLKPKGGKNACTNCGRDLSDSRARCPECGHYVDQGGLDERFYRVD